MIELALGSLLGLGLIVVWGDSSHSRLARRLAHHVRGVGRPRNETLTDGGAAVVLQVLLARFRFTSGRSNRRTRHRAIDNELPGVFDLLSLCMSAGMSPHAAIDRIGQCGRGIIAEECRRISSEISTGLSVARALADSDARVGHPGWSRLVDHIIAARLQGTPLTGILRALAEDERQAAGSRLLESASARETLMLFPLVFVILPVTVIVAIFPGISALGSIAL